MNKKYLGGIVTAAVVGLAGTFGAGTAQAADFPCSTAKLIVPWKAGGGTAVIFNIFENIINNEVKADPKIQVVTIGGQAATKVRKRLKTLNRTVAHCLRSTKALSSAI